MAILYVGNDLAKNVFAVHDAVRWLRHQGTARHRIPHEDLSFTGHVQMLRQH